mgnify:CR=1 FL=1
MLQRSSIIIISVLCLQSLQAGTVYKSENAFLFCLKQTVQPLEIIKRNGEINVNIEKLNDIFKSHQVKDIEPWSRIPERRQSLVQFDP